jgi:hypothetical protein
VTGSDSARPPAPPVGSAPLSDEEAALVVDAYIEALLASGRGAASLDPATIAPVDPDTARAVDALTDGLVRFHPSFRFEERLAARLRQAARGRVAAGTSWVPGEPPVLRRTDATGVATGGAAVTGDIAAAIEPDQIAHGATVIGRFALPDIGRALPDLGREVGRAVERVERVPVPVLVGGAIASGVSLAGAAIVAWRLSRRPLLPRLP